MKFDRAIAEGFSTYVKEGKDRKGTISLNDAEEIKDLAYAILSLKDELGSNYRDLTSKAARVLVPIEMMLRHSGEEDEELTTPGGDTDKQEQQDFDSVNPDELASKLAETDPDVQQAMDNQKKAVIDNIDQHTSEIKKGF
tara:strand:- start:6235 stop:6654 length:420 start_codon:yes stop_codon:yes gene_type:complete